MAVHSGQMEIQIALQLVEEQIYSPLMENISNLLKWFPTATPTESISVPFNETLLNLPKWLPTATLDWKILVRILVILVAAVIASVFVEVLLVVCGCTEFVFLKLVFRTHSTKEKLLEFLLCCYSLYCCFCYKGLFSFVMPTIQSIKMVGLLEMNLIKIFMPLLPVPLWNSREALVCWQIVGICFDVAFQATSDEKHVFLQSILVLLFGYYSIFSFFFFAQPILRTIPIILSWFESLITNREAAIAAAAIAVKEDSDEIHATLLLEEEIRARERAEEVIDLVNDNDDEQAEERRIGSIAKPSQWGEDKVHVRRAAAIEAARAIKNYFKHH